MLVFITEVVVAIGVDIGDGTTTGIFLIGRDFIVLVGRSKACSVVGEVVAAIAFRIS
jgi:hypothetical protein